MKEETALEARVGALLYTQEYIAPPLHALEFVFALYATDLSPLMVGRDPELQDQILHQLKWFSRAEVEALPSNQKHQSLRESKSLTQLFEQNMPIITSMII
jgi:hypothetical protein